MTQIIPTDALVPARRYVNSHLSVSRLKLFEQCPRLFEHRYIAKTPPPEGTAATAADFGNVLHETLEALFRWVLAEEHTGRLPEDKLLELYRDAWTRSGLSGAPLYQEGLSILRAYVRNHPDIDPYGILAVEQEFNLSLGEFVINGRIDRVDRINDTTIAIIDYKSNRLLFSREEVDADLQMSVYALAARALWPWATTVRFVFHMLRHGSELTTDRSQQQLDDAAAYVLATGRQSETGIDVTPHDAPEEAPRLFAYPPRLNPNCGYCDHRASCSAYNDALTRGDALVVHTPEKIEDTARLRERIVHVIKILERKKHELEVPIRAALEKAEEVTIAGVTYKLVSWTASTSYPAAPVRDRLLSLTTEEGLPAFAPKDLDDSVLVVDSKGLNAFLDAAVSTVPRAQLTLARLELDVLKETTPGTPRLHAHTPKGPAAKAIDPDPAPPMLPAPTTASAPASPAPTPATASSSSTQGSGKWTGRQRKKKEPWRCGCGFKGHGVAITQHRETCTQAPPKGTRVAQNAAKKSAQPSPQ